MGVKATDFGSILIEQHVGFKGDLRFQDNFLPTKLVGEGVFGRNENDNFGYSVSIDGDLAVVGVPYQDYDETGANSKPEAGAVFVYRRTRDSWEFAYKIVAGDREAGDNFGYSVSLKGGILLVGSPTNALNASQAIPVEGAGAAYVYEINETEAVFEAKLVPSIRDTNDNFGYSVKVFNDTAYVGSYMHGRDDNDLLDAPASGAVWAFTRDSGVRSWTSTKKIVAGGNDRNIGDNFGSAISAHKNTLVVGVPNFDYVNKGTDLKTNAGAAYIFEWRTDHWEFKSLLIAPDREVGDMFGSAVAVYDKRIAVSAPRKNNRRGKVYLYAQTDIGNYALVSETYPTVQELPSEYIQPEGNAYVDNSDYGSSLSLNSETLVVGAPGQASVNFSSIDKGVTPYTWTGSPLNNVGFTYVYSLGSDNSVILDKKFEANDRFNNVETIRRTGQFGFSVSIGTNIIVVGEPYNSYGVTNADVKTYSGLAHIYVKGDNGYEFSKTVEGFHLERNVEDRFASDFDSNERFMVFSAPNQDYDANHENYVSNAGAVYVWENIGGNWAFRQKITASDRAVNDHFGSKVVISGDRIFVQSLGSTNVGSVYVFRFENGKFVEKQKITNADVSANDRFGSVMLARDSRLFVSSTTAAITLTDTTVGAHGAVFAYTLNGVSDLYEFDAKILPSTAKILNSLFGTSLALNDNVLVVGSQGHTLSNSDELPLASSGAAFVFARVDNVWTQINKLTGPVSDRSVNDFMGYAVSSFGNILAVGVPGSDYDSTLSVFRNDAGKVYIFTRVNEAWNLSTTLTSPNHQEGGRFGASLSMGDNRILVGAPGETASAQISGWGEGRAYVFERIYGEWVVSATLSNDEPILAGPARRFGWVVSLDGNRIIVGEPLNTTDANVATPLAGAGAAWVYEKSGDTWIKRAKLVQQAAMGRAANNHFGYSVDIKGSLAIVGSPYDTKNEGGGAPLANAGSAFVFRRSETSEGVVLWNAERKLAGWSQDRNAGDLFGTAIAAYGKYVIVSATGHDYDSNLENFVNNAGAVYVYEWSNNALVYLQKLVAHDQADRISDVGFGNAVAINATHIVIGANLFTKNNVGQETGRQIGKVWSYKLENGYWIKERTFSPSATTENSTGLGNTVNTNFGKSLALSHLVLAIGAPGAFFGNNESLVTNAGAVEVYRYSVDKWVFERILTPQNRKTNDAFGSAITLRDNLAVIGGVAPSSSTTPINNDGLSYSGGAAWVFQYEIPNWVNTSKVARGQVERLSGDQFGNSAAIEGNTMVIGAVNQNLDDEGKLGYAAAGAAYVFKQIDGVWQFEKKLTSPNRQTSEKFGFDVAVKDDLIWVGAPGTQINSQAVGSAYSFRRNINKSFTRLIRKTARFVGTGAAQTFTVPSGVTELTAYVWGASGGTDSRRVLAGNGGFARVNIPVTAGEVLTLNVGRMPLPGGGGGRSEIIRDGSTLVVAGGGGGGMHNYVSTPEFSGKAGSAGGLIGEDGYQGNNLTLPGLGGTQTAGGASRSGAAYTSGTAGSFKQGGNGPTDATAETFPGGWPNGGSGTGKLNTYYIAGGGDGWYGGSAGAILTSELTRHRMANGGAGSSYIAPGLDGYTQTVKEFDDSLVLFPEITYRPSVKNDGAIALEWFTEITLDEWEFENQVKPTNVPLNTAFRFGEALDFDGATLVVGAPGNSYGEDNAFRGANFGLAFTYEFNGFEWDQAGALYPFGLNNVINSEFGSAVSVYEDFVVVGSPQQNYDEAGEEPLSNAGLVYVYRKINGLWTKLQRFGPPGNVRNAGDQIGYQVAYDNEWVAVGGPQHDYDTNNSNKVANSGTVFMWKWEAGTLVNKQKIIAPVESRVSNALFGSAIHFKDGELIIAAPGSATLSSDVFYRGLVFVYELNGDVWELKQQLASPAGVNQTSMFGASIDRYGDTLAVGSPRPDASAIRISSTSSLVYRPAPFGQVIDPNADWSIEFSFFLENTSSSYDLLRSLNYMVTGYNGTFGFNVLNSNLFFDVYNGVSRIFRMTATIAAGWNNIGFRRNGNQYQYYVNGVLQQTTTVSTNICTDIVNGLAVGNNNGNLKTIDYIRLNNASVDLTLNQGEEIGARVSTILYADYRTYNNNSFDDLTGNYFGIATGNATIVFVPGKATTENLGGVVHLFARNGETWEYTATVKPTGTNAYAAGDTFGTSLTLIDDFLIVGSPAHSFDQDGNRSLTNAGASYFFQNVEGTWTQQQKVVAWGHDANSGDLIGYDIATADTIIAVGAPNHAYDANGNNYLAGAGAVYVWRWDATNSLWVLEQKITAPNRVTNGQFGRAIALTETRLVVGAPSYDDPTRTGKAFVFEKTAGDTAINCWNIGTELIATGTNANVLGDRYGVSVAINSDNEVFVSSYNGYDTNGLNLLTEAGAVYVFKKTTSWAMQQKLVLGTNHLGQASVTPRIPYDYFGASISSSGNDLIIGIPYRDSDGRGNAVTNAGAAVAFTRADENSNWTQIQVITAKTFATSANQRLGTSVTGDGDYFAVGATGNSYDANEDFFMSGSGSVYVWHNTGTEWKYHQKLSGSIRFANGAFGTSVKMLGNLLFVGAPGVTMNGNAGQGALFVYELVDGVFEEIQIITLDTTLLPIKNASFGSSVDYDGETLAVGARTATKPSVTYYYGNVTFLERDSETGLFGSPQTLYDPNAPTANNYLGTSVSVSGELCIAGAPYEFAVATNNGSASIFRKTDGVWAFEDKIYAQRPVAESAMQFGASWAAEGNYLVVGAPNSSYDRLNRTVSQGGAVLVFERTDNVWNYKQRITPLGLNNHNVGDAFGTSIGLQNGVLVVGAPTHRYDASGTLITTAYGAVFSFELDTNDGFFKNQKKVSPQGYGSNEPSRFGTSLIFKENILIVGAPSASNGLSSADATSTGAGAAMIYKLIDGEWHFVQKLAPTGLNARDVGLGFGQYLSFNDGYLAIGVPPAAFNEFGEESIAGSGTVWTYKVESLDGLNVNLIGGRPNQPATTRIVFDETDGSFESVAVQFPGISYKGHPETVFSIDTFKGYALMNPVGLINPKLLSSPSSAVDPTVTVVNDPLDTTGSGATVVLTRKGSTLLSVNMTDSGDGYTSIPTVTADSGTGVSLQAVLQPTEVDTLTLTSSGSGFTTFPTILIDSPTSGGTTAQAHVVMETDSVQLQNTAISYVGETFVVDLNTTDLRVTTLTVDANNNITSIGIDTPGQFTALPSFTNLTTTRAVDTETFGAITESVAGESTTEDYGSVNDPVTSSEDYGLVTEPTTSSEDYVVSNNAVSYGSITESVVETKSYGPISGSSLTLRLTAKIVDFILDNPGSGYRRIPAVSFGGSFASAATAVASIVPTGVESVTILAPGNNLAKNTQIVFTGSNTRPATATASVSDGVIGGIQLTNAGSGYTRTPKIVFSEPGFAATIELRPTTVSSIVTTDMDPTLTIQGRVNLLRRLAEPNAIRRENQNFGSTIASHDNIIAVGAPTDAAVGSSVTTRSTSGSVMIYEVTNVNDRINKVLVDGWMDATTVVNNIGNTFAFSTWFRSNPRQQGLSQGTIFAITNGTDRPGYTGTPDGSPLNLSVANPHMLNIDNSGRVRISAGGQVIRFDISAFKLHEWNNVVYTCNGSLISVYVNGVLAGTKQTTATITANSLFSIGAAFDNHNLVDATVRGFVGYMSDITVWNTSLDQTDVDALQTASASTVKASNIRANWVSN